MTIDEYRRGIPAHLENGKTIGILCETKEQCITDDDGVALPEKLENKLAEAKEYSDDAYANSNLYTDTKIAELINGAPTTLDTLKEIADAMEENADVVAALDEAIGSKVAQAEYDDHADNDTIHTTSTEKETWNNKVSQEELQAALAGISSGDTAIGNAKLLNGLTAEEFVSNENLLVNSYFLDPVNSSGATEWTSGGTIIDNWSLENYQGTVTLSDDGITIKRTTAGTATGIMWQKIPINTVAGKTVTLSYKVNDKVYKHTYTFPETFTTLDTTGSTFGSASYIDFYKTLNNTDIKVRVVIGCDLEFTFEWIKLEIGSVATPFIPPNKEIEAVKCGVANADTVDGYHASDFATSADHNITTYTKIAQLGLTDDDFVADDFTSTITTLVTAMATGSILYANIDSATPNLHTAILTQLNTDMGTSYSAGFNIEITKFRTVNSPMVINVYVDARGARKLRYTCMFDTSSGVVGISKFAVTFNENGFVAKNGDTMSGLLKISAESSGTAAIHIERSYGDAVHTGMLYRDNGGGIILGLTIDGSWVNRLSIDTTGALMHHDGTAWQTVLDTGNSNQTVVVDTDPGVGASVDYADGTLIFVKEG